MSRTNPPPHGSPAGYDAGCRSKGGCAHDAASALLTCVEAAQRRRGDFMLARLPADVPLPRHEAPDATTGSGRDASEVHGTSWGYRRGCRSPYACPNWRTGSPTCADARAQYVRSWSQRRRNASDAQSMHGTSAMYLLGCRDPQLCPGDEQGRTCTQARREYRLQLRSTKGKMPKQEHVDAGFAKRRIEAWLADGCSIREIARRTGCGRSTIAAIARPENSGRTRISPQTLRRICAAAAPDGHESLSLVSEPPLYPR